ncbi:MAG: PilN domain-containing protein [bacterium]
MIKINLIPLEVQQEESKGDLILIAIVAAAVVIGALFALYASKFITDKRLDTELQLAEKDLKSFQMLDEKIKKLKTDQGLLEKRKGVISSLIENRLLYSVFMYDFVSLLPGKIWVQNITTKTNPDNSVAFDVTAKAFSAFSIADWLTTLDESNRFNVNELGRISTTILENRITYSFTLRLIYKKV